MDFEELKKIFFKRRKDWKLEIDPTLPCQGRCDEEIKTIKLQRIPDDNFELIVVHELCHSLPGCNTGTHGKVWQKQILKKAKIAEKLGMLSLSQSLIKEVEEYKKSKSLGMGTAANVYQTVEDFVMDDPDCSYDTFVKAIARKYGSTGEEFEKSWRRLKKVSEKAKKDWKERSKSLASAQIQNK